MACSCSTIILQKQLSHLSTQQEQFSVDIIIIIAEPTLSNNLSFTWKSQIPNQTAETMKTFTRFSLVLIMVTFESLKICNCVV